MKVGVVVTVHWSDKIRPNGDLLLKRFLDSLYKECTYDFHVYIVDNESEFKLDIPDKNSTYIRIDNQNEKGLTGAWNLGLNTAYNDGCDVLINSNEDLWFNNSLDYFINKIDIDGDDDMIYSVYTNGVIPPSLQLSNGEPKDDINLDLSLYQMISGFFFAFNRNHYTKYRYSDNEYFDVNNKYNGGDGKWGGQEGQFIVNSEKGAKGLVVGKAFVFHDKIRSWRIGKELDEESK